MAVCWRLVVLISVICVMVIAVNSQSDSNDSTKSSNNNDLDNYDEDEEPKDKSYYDDNDYDDPTPVKNVTKRPTYQKERNITVYTWGKWSKWSKCSRTCGGGVQVRIRTCKEKKPTNVTIKSTDTSSTNHITKHCKGVYKRFRMCNDKPCLHLSGNYTFRDQQCAAFNRIPFNDSLHQWKEQITEYNECELNCQTLDGNLTNTMKKSVVEGTPCRRPAVFYTHYYRHRAVCVEGICKAVHPKGAIRADTTNDSTYKCGSVLCRPVSEVFSKVNLPHGFYFVATIEVGALNISILHPNRGENNLVIKSSDDNYIINGNDAPPENGTYEYFGDIFEYEICDKFEKVTSKGPLLKAIDLLVNVNGPNKGIAYDYKLPVPSASLTDSEESDTQWNELGAPLDDLDKGETQESRDSKAFGTRERKKRRFSWKLIGFGPCNRSCGIGVRSPVFRCIRDIPTRFYSPRRCANAEKPVFNEEIYKCNMQICPPYWDVEEWGECVCYNGKGRRYRGAKCLQETAAGAIEEVNLQRCVDEKPETKGDCECPRQVRRRIFSQRSDRSRVYSKLIGAPAAAHKASSGYVPPTKKVRGDITGVWMMSDWNHRCSGQCGEGFEHRSIFCDRSAPYTDRCDVGITPDTFRHCNVEKKCSDGVWFASEWSECNGDCFNLKRRRMVLCIRDGVIAEDDECEMATRPNDVLNCTLKEVDSCGPKWHYSEWSECSRTCGEGIQRRFTKCLEVDQKENILRESNNCKYLAREPVYVTCNTQKCEDLIPYPSTHSNNVILPDCKDDLANCRLINKSRLCKLKYYQKNCCATCNGYGY